MAPKLGAGNPVIYHEHVLRSLVQAMVAAGRPRRRGLQDAIYLHCGALAADGPMRAISGSRELTGAVFRAIFQLLCRPVVLDDARDPDGWFAWLWEFQFR